MEAILVKVFATALALSQVTTRPDAVKTQFDPVADQAEVVQLLGDGCDHMRKAFDIENIDLDDLIATVMTDKQAVAGEIAAFTRHQVHRPAPRLPAVLQEREGREPGGRHRPGDRVLQQGGGRPARPQPAQGPASCPGMTTVLDGKGAKFAELFEPDNRRHWVPLRRNPGARAAGLRRRRGQALLRAQRRRRAQRDPRLHQHDGRAGQRQGGSTITQQVAKNLLVGDDVTYERKIREIIVASPRREDDQQAGDPGNLPQLDLSRPLVLGHRDGGAQLFRQARQGPHADRGRLPRRPDQGSGLLQSRPLPRARAGAARLRAEPHAGGRRHHRRADARRREAERLAIVALRRGRGATPASTSSTRSAARPRRSPASTA